MTQAKRGYSLPEYHGWAYKRNLVPPRNTQFYLRLRHGVLTAHAAPSDPALFRIPLHGANIECSTSSTRNRRITVTAETDTLPFNVATNRELQGWSEALQRSARWGIKEFYQVLGRCNRQRGHRAVRRCNQERVILKSMKLFRMSQSEQNKMRSEIDILESLHCTHVVRIIDVLEAGTDLVIATQPLDISLSEFLIIRSNKEQKISENEVKNIIYQVLRGVEELHFQNVVHGNIFADNVHFADSQCNIVKLTGFQHAVRVDENGYLPLDHLHSLTKYGNSSHLAPEALLDAPCNKTVDIFAVGCLLYKMVYGVSPWKSSTDTSEMYTRLTSPKLFPKRNMWGTDCSSCNHLIGAMLRIDPVSRISALSALDHQWFQNNTDALPAYQKERIRYNSLSSFSDSKFAFATNTTTIPTSTAASLPSERSILKYF